MKINIYHLIYMLIGRIDHFLTLWDFLNRRFFMNLDEEHCTMFIRLKIDLIKYYLVISYKTKNKTKLFEFFTKYSKDILSFGSGNIYNSINTMNGGSTGNMGNSNVNIMNGSNPSTGNNNNSMGHSTGTINDMGFDNIVTSSSSSSSSSSSQHFNNVVGILDGCENDLRKWYVLPYLENPEHDREFMVFFSTPWQDNLKLVLFNYMTVVLRSAPAPRLLLIDKWFRSETQMELRKAIESSMSKIKAYESLMDSMHNRIEGRIDQIYDHFIISFHVSLKFAS